MGRNVLDHQIQGHVGDVSLCSITTQAINPTKGSFMEGVLEMTTDLKSRRSVWKLVEVSSRPRWCGSLETRLSSQLY